MPSKEITEENWIIVKDIMQISLGMQEKLFAMNFLVLEAIVND